MHCLILRSFKLNFTPFSDISAQFALGICSLFYGPLYLHPQVFVRQCCVVQSARTCSRRSVSVLGAEVLLQCKDSSTHPLHRETPRVGYGPFYRGSHFLHSTRPAEPSHASSTRSTLSCYSSEISRVHSTSDEMSIAQMRRTLLYGPPGLES